MIALSRRWLSAKNWAGCTVSCCWGVTRATSPQQLSYLLPRSSQHLCLSPVWESQRQVDDRFQRRCPIGLGCLLSGRPGVYSGALLGNAPCSKDQLLHALRRQLLTMLGAWSTIRRFSQRSQDLGSHSDLGAWALFVRHRKAVTLQGPASQQ